MKENGLRLPDGRRKCREPHVPNRGGEQSLGCRVVPGGWGVPRGLRQGHEDGQGFEHDDVQTGKQDVKIQEGEEHLGPGRDSGR